MTVDNFNFGGELWPGTSKLIEECGELTQVLAKLIGNRGKTDYWGEVNLSERLEEELGDVIAAVTFFIDTNGLDGDKIIQRSIDKLTKFDNWHKNGDV